MEQIYFIEVRRPDRAKFRPHPEHITFYRVRRPAGVKFRQILFIVDRRPIGLKLTKAQTNDRYRS